MRTLSRSVAFLALFSVFGCGKLEFKNFTSPEGKFSVEMPGTPKLDVRNENGIKLNNYVVDLGNRAFLATSADLPPGPYSYEAGLNGIMARMECSLISKGPWKVGNSEGLAYELSVNKPAKGHATGRLLVVNNRIYQLMVLGVNAREDNPDVIKFIGSFKINQ